MIQVQDLSKAYGSQLLFDGVSFSINSGERIGLVGRNGHGKSTLLRMLIDEEHPDAGEIRVPQDYRIGHLSQKLEFSQPTVLEEGSLGLAHNDDGWQETYRVETVLHGLGFVDADFALDPGKLSGGYQIRLNLAKLLVSDPHLLLLDEPSNYLDIVSLRWLERFLRRWSHELVLITHDQEFMNKVITHTMAIHRSAVRKVKGPTTKLYQQLAEEEAIHEQTRLNQQRKREETEQFIRRFRAKATKAAAVQSRVKALEKMEQLERLQDIEQLEFAFNAAPHPGKWLMKVDSLSFGYDANTPLLEDLTFAVGKNDRIAVVGKNGKGKTTLLNVLASDLHPTNGSIQRSTHLQLQYFGQTNVDRLQPKLTVEEEIQQGRADLGRAVVRGICGLMMFQGDHALKRVEVLSGGERARVLLGKILVSPANLLLLDEPTNHLDIESAEALVDAITAFSGAVVIVTHSESTLRKIANRLIVFDGGKAKLFEGSYDDFLERVGWQDEEPEDSTLAAKPTLSKKELRRQRADFNKRRSEALRPLQKRVAQIEERIIQLEADIKQQTDQLIEVSRDGYGDEAAELSKALHQNKTEVEELFAELETVSANLVEQEQKFAEENETL